MAKKKKKNQSQKAKTVNHPPNKIKIKKIHLLQKLYKTKIWISMAYAKSLNLSQNIAIKNIK